ncbi:unnamed protein product [Spirodela intermedia]|uniref:DUF4005 domain-containing protein n=1 Tax=Spirodela intermedia TaxID=51605 RepID=A0A7I8JU53_SPIIN|nr:unnamed protein product [Spirodela intermedia]CAA6673634.1 unnamed protein product [Spirodela intermedia]
MGKAARWLRGLLLGGKKQQQQQQVPVGDESSSSKEKRRWGFARSFRDRDPQRRDVTAPPPSRMRPEEGRCGAAVGSYASSVASSHSNCTAARHRQVPAAALDEAEQNKRAIVVAAATAAVAEAAVAAAQAAAAVVRLTSSGRCSGFFAGKAEEAAAIKIQTAFRAYLARRALRALRALVKLQALVRGHIVRKQAAETLRCMQALVRVQARARARRSLPENSRRRPRHQPVTPPARHPAALSRHHPRLRPEQPELRHHHSVLLPQPLLRDMPHQSLSPLRTVATAAAAAAVSDGGMSESPQFYSAASSRRGSGGAAKSDCSRSFFSTYADHPRSYMANTESSRAKVRSQSAPKQRPEYEKLAAGHRLHAGEVGGAVASAAPVRPTPLPCSSSSPARLILAPAALTGWACPLGSDANATAAATFLCPQSVSLSSLSLSLKLFRSLPLSHSSFRSTKVVEQPLFPPHRLSPVSGISICLLSGTLTSVSHAVDSFPHAVAGVNNADQVFPMGQQGSVAVNSRRISII